MALVFINLALISGLGDSALTKQVLGQHFIISHPTTLRLFEFTLLYFSLSHYLKKSTYRNIEIKFCHFMVYLTNNMHSSVALLDSLFFHILTPSVPATKWLDYLPHIRGVEVWDIRVRPAKPLRSS